MINFLKKMFRSMHMLEKETVKMFEMQLKLLTRLHLVGESALPTIEPKLSITWLKIWNSDDLKSLNVYPILQVRQYKTFFFENDCISG